MYLLQFLAQSLWPLCFRRPLGNKHKISFTCKCSNKGQITAMSTHYLQNKCTLMTDFTKELELELELEEHWINIIPGCCCHNCINGFNYTMKGRISTNGHISSAKVIIYRTDHSHNIQMTAKCFLLIGYFSCSKMKN